MKYFIRIFFYLIVLSTVQINGQLNNVLKNSLQQDSLQYFLKAIKNKNISINNLASTDISDSHMQKYIEDRYIMVKKIIKNNPEELTKVLLEPDVQAKLLLKYKPLIERNVTGIRGNVYLTTFDDFSTLKQKDELVINSDEGSFLLKNLHKDLMKIKKGDVITINKGIMINNTILINNKDISIEGSITEPNPEVGNIRLLVILMSYLNSSEEELPSPEDFKKKFISDKSNIQNYLKEVSYGKAMITDVNVIGWIKVNRNYTYPGSFLYADELDKVITEYSVDMTKYDYVVYVNKADRNSLWGGFATVGKVYSQKYNTYYGECMVRYPTLAYYEIKTPEIFREFSASFIHEIGHNFGFGHANKLYTENDTLKIQYYGDYSDPMGAAAGHYSGYFKETVNWLDSSSVISISKDGDYTINNLENKFGKRLAKIKLGNDNQPRYLYLEYRNGTGLDDPPAPFSKLHPFNAEGLFLKGKDDYFDFYSPPYGGVGSLFMIDVHSIVPNGYTETLNGSNVYTDTSKQFQVGPIINRTDSTITFNVIYLGKSIDYPILIQPVDNWYDPFTSTFLDLVWGKVSGASSYELQISGWKVGGDASLFEKLFFTKILADTTIRVTFLQDTYFWRVRSIDPDGNHSEWSIPFVFNAQYIITGIVDKNIVTNYSIAQNYPNPFNPTTSIKYNLSKESRVIITIYNILGREMAKLIDEIKPMGNYLINWNASSLPSGVYIYKMEAVPVDGSKSYSDIKKSVLLK